MSRRNGNGSELELKLNLTPQRGNNRRVESPATSPTSSCVSSEVNTDVYSGSPEASSSSMMLVGCPRCLMYVMLAEADPRCPKCKSTVLLDFLHHDTPTTTTTTAAAKKTKKS